LTEKHVRLQKIGFRMRYLWMALLPVIAFASACKNGSGARNGAAAAEVLSDSTNFTSILWLDSVSKDFGKIQEGQKLEIAFRFRNTGDKPLVIVSVHPSCGCTVAEQPEAPIAPGGEGSIKAVFNSEGHPGIANKSLTVTSNTKGSQTHQLRFTAIVERKS
jgi:hypothetical protein